MSGEIREWIVDERKIRDYLLSKSHPIGRFKAAFLASLGYGPDDWQRLRAQLLEIASSSPSTKGEKTEFGQKYVVSGTLVGPEGKAAHVDSIWIVLEGSDAARLVTVYPR